MTANESESGSTENAADDSVAYKPEYSDAERVDVCSSLSLKAIGNVGFSVDHWQGADGPMLELRTHDDLLSGRFLIEPDRAEWLGRQLLDHVEAIREDRE